MNNFEKMEYIKKELYLKLSKRCCSFAITSGKLSKLIRSTYLDYYYIKITVHHLSDELAEFIENLWWELRNKYFYGCELQLEEAVKMSYFKIE